MTNQTKEGMPARFIDPRAEAKGGTSSLAALKLLGYSGQHVREGVRAWLSFPRRSRHFILELSWTMLGSRR
jgi:hypothetical protein